MFYFVRTKKAPKSASGGFFSEHLLLKQTKQRAVDAFNDDAEVLRIVHVIEVVYINDKQLAFLVATDPLLVMLVEVLEVLDFDVVFVVAIAPLNLLNEFGQIGAQVEQQVRRIDHANHGVEQAAIVVVITLRHQARLVQVSGENMRVFVDRAVLNDAFIRRLDLLDVLGLAEAAIEKIHLQMKRPAGHIIVKILQIRIMVNVFEKYFPVEVMR